jgi:hypothetical protein
MRRLLFVPSLPILVTLMMAVIRSSETSVLTKATWHHIPEEGIPPCTYFTKQLIFSKLFF